MKRLLVIWFNKNKNSYYYKFVSGFYCKYEVGYVNQYDHEVIMIIDVYNDLLKKVSLKKRVITKLISFLQKFNS